MPVTTIFTPLPIQISHLLIALAPVNSLGLDYIGKQVNYNGLVQRNNILK